MTKKTLAGILSELRERRGFDAKSFLARKLIRINNWFLEHGIDSCVIGVSGGIDSAVAVALLSKAAKLPASPIKGVLALSIPIYNAGTTGQKEATDCAWLATRQLNNVDYKIVDISDAFGSVANASQKKEDGVHKFYSEWVLGQLAPIMRTPVVYYHAAELQARGYKSVVAGTINRDEGAYIGYFGKASDATVDIQLLHDLHKSEVMALARLLEVPNGIVGRAPTGDVFDGKTDGELIGAPYWFIELYQLIREYDYKICPWVELSLEEARQFCEFQTVLDALHAKNKHKYQVGHPSFHI